MRLRTVVAWIAVAAVFGVAVWWFDKGVWQSAVAVLAGAAMLRVGWLVIAGLAQPVPDPPAPGELRKVKLVYRCALCGAEVRMTAAASEDPEPPRHCMEEMELLTPVE
ncbi:MAG: hypothetical protein R2698_04500 [Microthrixaceae bacterium]